MPPLLRRALAAANLFGLDLRTTAASAKGLTIHLRNRREYRRQAAQDNDRTFPHGKAYPCLADRFLPGGTATGHYFHMDLHCAQLLARRNPQRHIDVGSRIDGFVAHVASYRQIEVLDIRPINAKAHNITFHQHDLMKGPGNFAQACDSLSCLHALEHLGLGRYGDTVDYKGHLKGWDALHQMLKPGGKLYFAVPMGSQRTEFDAHRVFSMNYLLKHMISGKYTVDSFAYVNDKGDIILDTAHDSPQAESNFGCTWGWAPFDLIKVS